jgi:S1-C subfamily serine protease
VEIKTDQGLGSGVIFDTKGDIVTNYHVVEGSTSYTVTFSDGTTAPATLVGTFRADDLAVVHVTQKVTPLPVADSSKLLVGDIVLAVGNPLGFTSSVTEGVVSATGRTIPEGNGVVLVGAIQTSAAINPGNSGGALVDISGSLIGIPTLAALDPQLGGAAPGIGFAIPSNTVNSIATQLIATGHVTNTGRSYLGIAPQDLSFGNGVYVARVFPGSPAATAGIQAGDIINKIDGKTMNTAADLQTYVAEKNVGDVVKVELIRGNVFNSSTTTISVTLAALPGS